MIAERRSRVARAKLAQPFAMRLKPLWGKASKVALPSPKGTPSHSEGMAWFRQAFPGVSTQNTPSPTGMSHGPSIPSITFIPLHLVPLQEDPKLVLKTASRVVFLLFLDVGDHRVRVRLAHRKNGITFLPIKPRFARESCLHPSRSHSLQLADPIRDGNLSSHPRQDMNVVRHPTDDEGGTIELLGDAANEGKPLFSLDRVFKPLLPILRGEHQMHNKVRKRLRHGRHRIQRRPRRNPVGVESSVDRSSRVALAELAQPFAMRQKPLWGRTGDALFVNPAAPCPAVRSASPSPKGTSSHSEGMAWFRQAFPGTPTSPTSSPTGMRPYPLTVNIFQPPTNTSFPRRNPVGVESTADRRSRVALAELAQPFAVRQNPLWGITGKVAFPFPKGTSSHSEGMAWLRQAFPGVLKQSTPSPTEMRPSPGRLPRVLPSHFSAHV